jgi:hypothetical protein
LRERATLGVQHVRDHDLRAGACERPRLGRSLAAAAAGDEKVLFLKFCCTAFALTWTPIRASYQFAGRLSDLVKQKSLCLRA